MTSTPPARGRHLLALVQGIGDAIHVWAHTTQTALDVIDYHLHRLARAAT